MPRQLRRLNRPFLADPMIPGLSLSHTFTQPFLGPVFCIAELSRGYSQFPTNLFRVLFKDVETVQDIPVAGSTSFSASVSF